jgi:hypothetical protein
MSQNVPAITSVGAVSTQERIAALQEQMALYAQYANSASSSVTTEYRALQSAIASGNVIGAEVALAQLQKSKEAGSSAPAVAPAAPAPASPSAPPSTAPAPHSLNTVA